MKRVKLLVLTVLFSMLLTACQDKENYIELTQKDAGKPYSDWDVGTTGSAKYLDGETVLISIYLKDTDALWTASDKKLAKKNLKIACDFLVEEGKRYGKEVELIYDIEEHPDLEYYYEYNKPFPGSTINSDDTSGEIYDLLDSVDDYIDNAVPTKELMEKYQVNSIAYVVFVDSTASVATAYSYYYNIKNYNYNEVCFINLRWSAGTNVNPDTYAHELLHLFGARDLYYSDSSKGISVDFVKYVSKSYPKDIMLGNATKGVSWNDKISASITEITAYFIGWKDYIYEVEKYPEIKSTYPASSFYDEEKSYDYKSYTLKTQKIDEDYFFRLLKSRILSALLILVNGIIIIRHIVLYNRQRKAVLLYEQNKDYETKINDVFFDKTDDNHDLKF